MEISAGWCESTPIKSHFVVVKFKKYWVISPPTLLSGSKPNRNGVGDHQTETIWEKQTIYRQKWANFRNQRDLGCDTIGKD